MHQLRYTVLQCPVQYTTFDLVGNNPRIVVYSTTHYRSSPGVQCSTVKYSTVLYHSAALTVHRHCVIATTDDHALLWRMLLSLSRCEIDWNDVTADSGLLWWCRGGIEDPTLPNDVWHSHPARHVAPRQCSYRSSPAETAPRRPGFFFPRLYCFLIIIR